MKKTLTLLTCIFLTFVATSCSSYKEFSSEYTIPNMHDYIFINNDKQAEYRQITVSSLLKEIQSKDTSGVVILTATWCEFCQRAISIFNDVAFDNEMPVYYINSSHLSADEIDEMEKLANIFPDLFPFKDGSFSFVIPMVISVYKGEVKAVYTGIGPDITLKADDTSFQMNQEQITFLSDIYSDMFSLAKKGYFISK